VHYTEGSISVNQKDNLLYFTIYHPEQWNFAKISVIKSNSEQTDTITATPNRDASIKIRQNGEYWIEAKIKVNGETFDAYNTITVNSVDDTLDYFDILDIPQRQIIIVLGIVAVIGIVGIVKRKISMHDTQDLHS
jgi:minor extracellular serine protease Vpr